MKHEKRSKWSSQATFILAAIGSAVGLGNACLLYTSDAADD